MKKFAVFSYVCIIVGVADNLRAADELYFTSSPTSWVGNGTTRTFTPLQGFSFGVESPNSNTNDIDFRVTGNSENWFLDFIGINNSIAVVGSYSDAERYPFESKGHPGLSFIGDGRGDNTLTGSFRVLQNDFDLSGHVMAFAADFAQYDEGDPNRWNYGSIRFNSDIPVTIVPEPTAATLLLLGMLGYGWRRNR